MPTRIEWLGIEQKRMRMREEGKKRRWDEE